MAAIRVVSTDDVRSRMAMSPELTENDDAILSAIDSAQQRLEAEYGMVFKPSQFSDLFYASSHMFHGVRPKTMNQFLLRKPFVDSLGLTVTYGSSVASCDAAIAPEFIDYAKGVVFLNASVDDKYVKVAYTAGFADKASVPQWVREAVLAYAPVMFNLGAPTNNKGEVDNFSKQAVEHVRSMVISNHRNTGFMFKPL